MKNVTNGDKDAKPEPGPPARRVLIVGTLDRDGKPQPLTALQVMLILGAKPRKPLS